MLVLVASEPRVLIELVPLSLARCFTLYPVTGYCGGVQVTLTVERPVFSSEVMVGVATAVVETCITVSTE